MRFVNYIYRTSRINPAQGVGPLSLPCPSHSPENAWQSALRLSTRQILTFGPQTGFEEIGARAVPRSTAFPAMKRLARFAGFTPTSSVLCVQMP